MNGKIKLEIDSRNLGTLLFDFEIDEDTIEEILSQDVDIETREENLLLESVSKALKLKSYKVQYRD